MYGGGTDHDKSYAQRVRAVRGTPLSDHFVINGDNTVTDVSTGLMWQQAGAESEMSWDAAISHCEGMSLAGYNDWRLPNREELRSIVDYNVSDPAIKSDFFSDTVSSMYWSSSTILGDSQGPFRAWGVYFGNGIANYYYKSDAYYVRAVRGGQAWLFGHLFISSPKQGSTWVGGNSMGITWETQGIAGNVKISVSRQGGKDGTFETIAESTENDGSYSWTVTEPASFNCVLKVGLTNDTSKETTQGLFAIYPPVAPTVTTGTATSVATTSATLNGTVNPNGASTTTIFEYGTTTGYGSTATATQSPLTGTNSQSVSVGVTSLTQGVAYHFRVKATNSAGTVYGSDVTFATISEQGSPVTISSVSGARGKKVVIPIILSNIEGSQIASLSVDVGYDTTYFEKPKGDIGPAGSASEKTIGTSEPSSGIFRMTILSVSNNNVIGDGVIAYLTLTILSNAPGSSSILTSTPSASDPSGSDVAVVGASGTTTILGNMAGDCNGDGNVTIAEVQSAINMYLGINAVEDCVDVNGNGKVSIGELQKVINNHLNINAAGALEYTESGGQAHVNATAIAPSLDVGQVSGSLGETVTIPVTLTNASGYQVSGVSTDITYDTSYLESPSVSIGAAGTSAGKDVGFNEISSGTIRVGVFSASNNNAIGDGIVAYVSFKIKSSASSGQTTLGNTPSGSDPSGNDITMGGADGVVTVSYSSTRYVNSDGICEGNDPCYTTIQAAINEASTGEAIMISADTYDEDITLDADKSLTLIGSSTGSTILRNAPKARQGSLTLQKMTILPQ